MTDLNILLNNVEHPGRYTGGEWGIVEKDTDKIDIRFAFCFPDTYEVGMSHLGMKIHCRLPRQHDDPSHTGSRFL